MTETKPMRVRVLVKVSPEDRYVIAKYFEKHGGEKKSRATRKDVVRFVKSSMSLSIREQADSLRQKRQRNVVTRLRSGEPAREPQPEIVPPDERQLNLFA